jgi:hypothetical protein
MQIVRIQIVLQRLGRERLPQVVKQQCIGNVPFTVFLGLVISEKWCGQIHMIQSNSIFIASPSASLLKKARVQPI